MRICCAASFPRFERDGYGNAVTQPSRKVRRRSIWLASSRGEEPVPDSSLALESIGVPEKGKSEDETVAAHPSAAFDAKFQADAMAAERFIRPMYEELKSKS